MSNYTATGLEDASSGSSEYNAHRFIAERRLAQVNTGTLVQIQGNPYNANGNAITPGTVGPVGFVDVLPLVNQLDGANNSVPHQIVHGLPYIRIQGGSNAIICDPQNGDIGYVSFADRDISTVKSTLAQANPGSRRRFDMADGVYKGLCVSNTTPNQYIIFTNGGITIQDMNNNSIIMNSNGIVITDTNGNIITMNSSGINFKDNNGNIFATKHTHSGVMTGGGNTGPPVSGT